MALPLPPMILSTMLLPSVLLTPMLARITTALLSPSILRRMWLRRVVGRSTLKINIHPPLIRLGLILQSQVPTNLFHPRLNLLHMINTMVPLAHNHVQMRLALTSSLSYPFLEHVLCFFDEKPMEINGVGSDAVAGVVCAEYVVSRLLVVLVHLGRMLFALLAQFVRAGAVARGIGLVGTIET